MIILMRASFAVYDLLAQKAVTKCNNELYWNLGLGRTKVLWEHSATNKHELACFITVLNYKTVEHNKCTHTCVTWWLWEVPSKCSPELIIKGKKQGKTKEE